MAIDFNKIRKGAAQSAVDNSKTQTDSNALIREQKQNEDIEEITKLGIKYFLGEDGYQEDNEQAFKLFQHASDLGGIWAKGLLGRMYYKGYYVDVDIEKAKSLLKIAADDDYPFALNDLGDIYYHENNFDEAFSMFEKSAGFEDPYGMWQLGQSYLFGEITEQDLDKAEHFLLKAANEGVSSSYMDLGFLYDEKGKDEDSFKWFKKSAEEGFIFAMSQIGWYYAEGKGVSLDYKEARKWFEKACEGENSNAQFGLAILYEFGYGVKENKSKAMEYYRLAANQGHHNAELAVQYNGWTNVPDEDLS